jgi:hypothetical protein
MTITLDESKIESVKDANAHSRDEVNTKSRKRRILGRPVRGPEAVAEWQWYAFLCKFLVYTRSTVGLGWYIRSCETKWDA